MRSFGFAVLTLFAATISVRGEEVKVGDKAPSFQVKDDTGETWKSDEHFGKGITVVYFYPADMTGGCTKQACSYRDDSEALKKLGVTVVGVSGDTVENHQAFKKEKELNFTLLADTEGKVATAFGVPYTAGEKEFVTEIGGQKTTLVRALTTRRWTFVIGENKKVIYKDDAVQAQEDSQKIIALVKSLKK
ncbi:MAG: peroxiredoxin [Planctomycetaceae bacterium]|nr:peroxiredoxin [Planctomycetaceae bacterium]MCB9953018.1 peroxiredoxin [Planctomycetaceae bacterium]